MAFLVATSPILAPWTSLGQSKSRKPDIGHPITTAAALQGIPVAGISKGPIVTLMCLVNQEQEAG